VLTAPHHDPSERYVSNPNPAPGETVTVWLEAPPGAGVAKPILRTMHDGEEAWAPGRRDGPGLWRFELVCRNPVTRYRFWLDGPGGPRWHTGLGVVHHDPAGHHDHRLLTTGATPAWVPETVWYQVFPDRFAPSERPLAPVPAWADLSPWDEPVSAGRRSMTQLYGGDLDGIVDHLDHLVDLGVGGIYLNPVFPARSNHRYDAASFAAVDPLLGGDAALARLRQACDRASLRLIGDLTLNHTGAHHEWFTAAQADPGSAEAGFYYFTDHPHGYDSWMDVASLPKLNHASVDLQGRLYDGENSVLARFLNPPFGLDGWRIDVANMTGRRGLDDHNELVRTMARRTSDRVDPERWLVAEHFFDPSADAGPGGWHGFMNYAGIGRPVASWLGRPELLARLTGGPGQAPRTGELVARAIDEARASLPWQTVLGSMALVGSHDTPRWHSLARSPELARVGAGLVLSLPGSPCLFYGDEVGLTGNDAEQARRPMPWDRASWNEPNLRWYRELIRFRSQSRALAHGGFRWVERAPDALAFLRQSIDERLLVRATRAATTPPLQLSYHRLGAAEAELVAGTGVVGRRNGALVFSNDQPGFGIWRLA
jgi:alpha-glucosidase